jgi:LacI family transcriptional regulator
VSSHTINDVAALARVSIKTVSRVMNGEAHVRPQMRERVMRAVEALKYRPNIAARSLAGSRSFLIGLFCEHPSPSYVAEALRGAMARCREAGYHILIEQLWGDKTTFRQQLETLLTAVKMDGVILLPPVCDRDDALEILDQRAVPYVRIAPSGQLKRGPYVYMDDRKAAFDMTAHLVRLGHKKIGFIKGRAGHASSSWRHDGFQKALLAAGLKIKPHWIQPGDYTMQSGMAAAEQMLRQKDRPTAIFASNDDMAFGVMAVAQRLKLKVPEELSVVGFDDAPIAQVVWPQLTTIRQPTMKMAVQAASLLIQPDKSKHAPKGELLDFELIVRGSAGIPPRT